MCLQSCLDTLDSGFGGVIIGNSESLMWLILSMIVLLRMLIQTRPSFVAEHRLALVPLLFSGR